MRSPVASWMFATLLCLSLIPVTGDAAKRHVAAREQAESALLVSGTIDITAEGKVVGHTLDHLDRLPPGIVKMVERLAPQWTFEPVALPENTIGRSKMNLHFVAKRLSDSDYRIELRSASFDAEQAPGQDIAIARRGRMPSYPPNLAAMEVNGTVYLVVQVGRDGKVMNADASHVNLRTVGAEADMAQWRNQLSEASIKAIRSWTFTTPTAGDAVDAPYWIGRLPVEFTILGTPRPKLGKWETYIPGPRKPIPWADSLGTTDDNSDALTPNEFHTDGGGRRLIGPPGGS